MIYRFESIEYRGGRRILNGFALGKQPEAEITYAVFSRNMERVNADIVKLPRNDVGVRFLNRIVDNDLGFSISFECAQTDPYFLVIHCGDETRRFRISENTARYYNGLMELRNSPVLRRALNSVRAMRSKELTYPQYLKKTSASKVQLQKQREMEVTADMPKFSVVIPLYNTPHEFMKALCESILEQTYPKFEVCFADGSADDSLAEVIASFKDERLRYLHIGENLGISGNTNKALEMAEGDFIMLCDHDDLLTPDAFYEMAQAVMNHPECDCVYSDEDKIDQAGKNVYEPHFKPDFNIDMLRSENYICHLFAVRKTLTDTYGGFNSVYDGAQDFDFILRMCEHAREVVHVPKVLYHWRSSPASTASNPESKMYAYKAGAAAVKAHYERALPEVKITDVIKGANYGLYHVLFHFDEKPLISVIIPNKDHIADLERAVSSLLEKSTWGNFEVIIVENNSEQEETFRFYETLQKKYSQVRVLNYAGEFNYSAVNNMGVKAAKGEYILLMNNDVELIEETSVEEMMGYAQREDVGAVGCRLLYENGAIQHAGVIIGIGVADHAFKGTFSADGTYFNRAMTPQDYSAVTAAVMLTKKSVYLEAGGLDEKLAVAFNDIDYCLRLNRLGKLVVYNPYACFHHYESLSRGQDNTSEKNARYMSELSLFTQRWQEIYKQGDPYYNPNLTLEKTDFSLRKIS